jgi:hypothetical protein
MVLVALLRPMALLVLAAVAAAASYSPPPFAHTYHVQMHLGRPGAGGPARPFVCSASTADGTISCGGASCAGGCIAINATYTEGTAPPHCSWQLDDPCKALPAVRSSNCEGLAGLFTSVNQKLTVALTEKLMNNCTDAGTRENQSRGTTHRCRCITLLDKG